MVRASLRCRSERAALVCREPLARTSTPSTPCPSRFSNSLIALSWAALSRQFQRLPAGCHALDWVHIGNAGLHQVDSKNGAATFGIFLGEKGFWSQGFGTDAARTMLAFAFDELRLHRVELMVYDFNPRARRCYEKAGFRLEGTRRQALFRWGRFHDIHSLAILEDEFRAGRAGASGPEDSTPAEREGRSR